MLKDIVKVKPLNGFRLRLRFEDGIEGELNIRELIQFEGVFEPLLDPRKFAEVKVNTELGTIVWPNGADLDPDVLHAALTGKSISVAA